MRKGESSRKYLTECEQEIQTSSLFTSELIYLGRILRTATSRPLKPSSETECSLLCDLGFLQPSFRQRSCFVLGYEGSSQRPDLVLILIVDTFEQPTRRTKFIAIIYYCYLF